MRTLVLLMFLLTSFAGCSAGTSEDTEVPGGSGSGGGNDQLADIEVEEGKNLVGKVKYEDGTPAVGVVVSDGYSCTQTDGEGVYQLTRNKNARNVIISYPADCKIEVKENQIPDFFRAIDNSQTKVLREDFTLTRLEGGVPESFLFYPIGDPQIKTRQQMTRFVNEILLDLNDNVSEETLPAFAITLGDVCDWNPEMFEEVATVFSNLDIPCFHVIGNHDRDWREADESSDYNYYISTLRSFEKYYTPVNYSFNYGHAHFVILDDIQDGPDGYEVDLNDDEIEWLRQDLSYVPKDKLLIVCAHGPIRNRASFTKRAALMSLISQYETRIFSGHTHTNFHLSHNDYGGIQEHVVGAACGMYWYSSICIDGTPLGYAKYLVEGATIKNGIYKAGGYDEQMQARLYDQTRFTGWNNDPELRQYVYCNVWNSTPEWTVELYEDGEFSAKMERWNGYDYSINDWIYTIWEPDYQPEPVTTDHQYRVKPKNMNSKKSPKITDSYGQVFWIDRVTTNYNAYYAPAN